MKPVEHYWASINGVSLLLWPLSLLFCLIAFLRKWLFRTGLKSSSKLQKPVIVVGNISVGGTGKSPLVIWLCGYLEELGYHPGVVSRGYGAKAQEWPKTVTPESDPQEVGDEPLMIARRTGVPMVISPDRPQAGEALLKEANCDLVISDDGLQHYALQRDIEIAVLDAARGFGNGFCLPAGPLRERPQRLKQVNLVIGNGATELAPHQMVLKPTRFVDLKDPSKTLPLDSFRGQKVHGVAGIGNPERFFDTLRGLDLEVESHPYQDHHRYRPEDLPDSADKPLIMTEKDAVKCLGFGLENAWYLEVTAEPDSAFSEQLEQLIRDL